jgi:ELWxxDGT repeat protein
MFRWKKILVRNSKLPRTSKQRNRKSSHTKLDFSRLEQREMMAVNVYSDLNSVPNSSFPTQITEIPNMQTGGIAFSAETAKGWTLVTEDVSSNRIIHTLNGAELAPTEITHVRDSNGQDWVYFSGVDQNGDRELYRLKWGTTQITRVRNINLNGSSEPKGFTAVNQNLFFTAWNLATGRELWMTNSDTGETKMVGDLTPGSASSNPREMIRFVDRVYFVADSAVHGTEVFSSVGTEIKVLRNIGTGATGSDPSGLTVSGLHLYFAATSPIWGREVWKSNGAHLGNLTLTNLLADLAPNAGSSNPLELTPWNGGLAFTAEKPASGRELYRYEPNVLNTTFMLRDIFPGATGSDPSELTVANGVLFFSANSPNNGRELWKSQGFAANTVLVKDLNPSSSAPQNLINAGGRVYFTAEHPSFGRELYRSDGTPETTFLVRDISQGLASSNPGNFAVANSRFFFSATNTQGDRELWYSWGTGASTHMLDIFPGTRGSAPYMLTKFGSRIAFVSNHQALTQLYVTSGPGMTGTMSLMSADDANFKIDPTSLQDFGGSFFFLKKSLTGADRVQLWKSDGTVAGTVMVKEILGTVQPGELFKKTVGSGTGAIFYMFLQTQPGIFKLWKSDGTSGGTTQINPSTDFREVHNLTDVNGRFYFVSNVNNGRQLWRSLGTSATTTSFSNLTNPNSFTVKGDDIFFFALNGNNSNFYRITKNNSPVLVRRNMIGNGPGVNLNGMMYFAAKVAGDTEFRVWRTDGRASSFVLVKPTGVTDPQNFRIAGGKVYFTARYNTTNPPALMVTDGTSAGTRTLVSFSAGYNAFLLGTVGNELIFLTGNYTNGFQVRRTNGTLAGTSAIGEINNRFTSIESMLFDSQVIDNTLYFTAIDQAFGWELFTWTA